MSATYYYVTMGEEPIYRIWLSDVRYLEALKRFRDKITSGAELSGFNTSEHWADDNDCTWGFCSQAVADWPDVKDHILPWEMPILGSPKFLQRHQRCPLERPYGRTRWKTSCFHRCRFFKPLDGDDPLNQENALILYDAFIEVMEESCTSGPREKSDEF